MFKKTLAPVVMAALLPIAASAAMLMHGMPMGTMGADGVAYTGAPNLAVASSLVAAGGTPQHFSIVAALRTIAGNKIANGELLKLTKQYGPGKVANFVKVQNFTVDQAVRDATAAGVKFPAPTLKGRALGVALTKAGLEHGTYYEGVMLDHAVSHPIHEAVMGSIDTQYSPKLDANYHRIADQAHYDLAQALGMTSVKLAAYH